MRDADVLVVRVDGLLVVGVVEEVCGDLVLLVVVVDGVIVVVLSVSLRLLLLWETPSFSSCGRRFPDREVFFCLFIGFFEDAMEVRGLMSLGFVEWVVYWR